MKRILMALALSLFVGLFATISTAWLFATLSDDQAGIGPDSMLVSTGSWHVFASHRIGVWDGVAMISLESSPALHIENANIPEWSRLGDLPEYSRGDPMPMLYDSGYGWPFLSMWCSIDAERDWQTGTVTSRHTSGSLGNIELPIRILGWGFAGDAAFFTILGLLILILPRSMRRWWRATQGRCHSCGYDLRNDLTAGCSECGWRREEGTERQQAGIFKS